jgi:uncharacterized protein (DUF4415 family)
MCVGVNVCLPLSFNAAELKPITSKLKMFTHPKIPTTLRLSPEVIAYFKATGEGWQTRVDAALREYIQAHPTH